MENRKQYVSNQLAVIKEKATTGRISVTQVIRHVFQIAGFLLMPWLFIVTLGSFRIIWQSALAGQFTWEAMGASFMTLVAVLPVTAVWGRFFCGYLCSFGGMQELFRAVGKKLGVPELKVSQEQDKMLRSMKYVVLGGLFLFWTFGVQYETASPWNVFGQYSTIGGWGSLAGWLTVGGLLLLVIMGVSMAAERAFCRYFCPLGGVFSLISGLRMFKIKRKSSCVGCSACAKVCPMGIEVASAKDSGTSGTVNSSECIDCFRCVDKCPSRSLCASPKEAAAGSAAALAISGLYKVGNIVASTPLNAYSGTTVVSQGRYVDGTYQGSAQGYRGPVSVRVTVSGGSITAIDVESYSDDDDFFNRAKNTVISEIISGQTTDVQTVSGATFSSRGIINAVADALGITSEQTVGNQADSGSDRHGMGENGNGGGKHRPGGNDGGKPGKKPGSDNGNNDNGGLQQGSVQQNADLDFKNLKDGTYTGTGNGRNGSIEVTVKVSKGKVTSITVESSREDADYMNRARDTVIGEIIDGQTLNVQTVSGATMSSNGIIEAVADALDITFTNPNSSREGRGSRRGH